MIQLLYNQR